MKTLISRGRINIRGYSFHNPFSSGLSKASDPRINSLTLARLSYSSNRDIRRACVINLCDRMESAAIRPVSLPLFDNWVTAVAIACLHTEEMPNNRRSDKIYSGIVKFVEGCSPELLKTIAASTGQDQILGLIWSSRIPEDINELSAFSIIAFRNNPYAKLAFDKILVFWPRLNDASLRLFVEKAANQKVREAALRELEQRTGQGAVRS